VIQASREFPARWLISRPLRTLRAMVRRMCTKPLESLPDCPDIFRTYRELTSAPGVNRRPGGWEYKAKFYPDYLTVGGASQAISREALRYCKGHGVDVGAGLWPLPGSLPVDIWRGAGSSRAIADIAEASLDYVFSSHCLEHNLDWESQLSEWVSKLKPDGIVFLYLPHPDCGIWEVGSPFVGTEHKWTPTPEVVRAALERTHCTVIARNDGPDVMYSFWLCAKKDAN
jgi:Methyltransferase domain